MLRLPVKGSWLTVISPCMWSCSCSKTAAATQLRSYCFLFCVWMFQRHSIVFFLPSHSKNQYLFRLPNPRVCSKEKRNQSPPVFWVVFKLSQVPPAGKEEKRKKEWESTFLREAAVFFRVKTSHVLPFLLVVGRGSAGENHSGEQGEGSTVNGVSSQSEAKPLRYLSQEVCSRHILKHSTCRWN